jgi:ferrous iron transport protein B
MELPPYRLPAPRVVLRQAWMRTASFVKGAGGPIMGAVLVVWLLLSIPPGSPEQSLYARVSKLLLIPLQPLGVTDWRLAGALIPGFIAKEVVIGTLGVSYLGSEPLTPLTLGAGLQALGTAFYGAVIATLAAIPQLVGLPSPHLPPVEAPSGLPAALANSITPAGALAYLVLVQLYTPCVATLAAIRQEFGRRWAAFSLFYMLIVAYVLAFVAGYLL